MCINIYVRGELHDMFHLLSLASTNSNENNKTNPYLILISSQLKDKITIQIIIFLFSKKKFGKIILERCTKNTLGFDCLPSRL